MDNVETENGDGTEAVEQPAKKPGIVTKKMLVASSMLCGAIAFLLWAVSGFPRKFKNPRTFEEKTCTGDATICPQGWNRIHNKCFFRFELEKTWRDSQANCMTYHGSLVMFTFQDEVEILTHYLGPSSYWIGLKKQNESKHWMWANGDALNNWFTIGGSGNCAFLFKKGISSANCDDTRKYICSRKVHKLKKIWKILVFVFILIITAVIVRVLIVKLSECLKTMECSREWIGVREKCFYFSNATGNWTASQRFCSSHGSELAQIDTQDDMEFLKKQVGTFMHWIGLSRKQGEPWKWTNGTTFNLWFEITGDGPFAFLKADGVYSSRGFVDIKWICSKPRF